MTISAFSGPIVTFNDPANPEAGPNLSLYGNGLLDPRTPFTYNPGQNVGAPTYGFVDAPYVNTMDQVPATIATANIAALQTTAGAGALTLVSSTAAGITVGVSITNAASGATVASLLAIDGAAGYVLNGNPGTIRSWDPTKLISRAVSFTSTGNISAVNFTVNGYDIYGYAMTQTRAGPNNNTVNTTKAFKYISSITVDGAVGTNTSVGTSDIIGLPMRADRFSQVEIYYNNALITASTGFVAAVTTSPATASTGDVRGTYALQSASDGTKRIQMYSSPALASIGSSTGMFGVTQV